MTIYQMRNFLITLPIVLLVLPGSLHAQKEKLVQLTGRIISETFEPLPYAHVLVLNADRGTISDSDGKFSFVVRELDTIMFSTIGYKRYNLIIPDTLKEPFINMDIMLQEDTIYIGEIRIYPWKSYEEFKEAFVNLKLPEDDLDNARRNIAYIKTQIILDNNPSPGANFRNLMEQQLQESYTHANYPSYQILNPFAWAKFFEALKRGDFKRKE
jgi:hypothetical protein